MKYTLTPSDIDVKAPLIYMWEIHDKSGQVVGRYVGKAIGGDKRPTTHYSRNVNKLLRKEPYKAGKDYRRVHYALANAVQNGYQITLSYLCNVPNIAEVFNIEAGYINEYGCNKPDGIGLNGPVTSRHLRVDVRSSPAVVNPVHGYPARMTSTPSNDESGQVDLEDFIEFVITKYSNVFDIIANVKSYSFWINGVRLLRAKQAGPRSQVKVKFALTSPTANDVRWDGGDTQLASAIDAEIALHNASGSRRQISLA